MYVAAAPVSTILHVFPSFDMGGAQMRFIRIANHFGARWRHIIVALDGTSGAFGRLLPEVSARLLQVPVRSGETLSNLGTYRHVLRELKPDLLVTSNWGSIDWALANLDGLVRHLHTEDGFGPDETVRQRPRRVWTRRLALRRATILVPSRGLYAAARDLWRLPRRHLAYVPNGIDCQRFARPPDPAHAARLGLGEGDPIIGTVAALRPEKNLGRLLEAFALVLAGRPARLAIIGDGPERARLAERAAALGLGKRVVFTGADDAPERLLPSFQVFALSSDTEQMPLSLLEAMAAGLPAAATDVGDVAAMVAPANRPHIVARDAGALALALHSLLADPAAAAAIGAANAARARAEFDQPRMFAAFEQLYDGLPAPASTPELVG